MHTVMALQLGANQCTDPTYSASVSYGGWQHNYRCQQSQVDRAIIYLDVYGSAPCCVCTP